MEAQAITTEGAASPHFGPLKGILVAVGMMVAAAAGSLLVGFGWGIGVAFEAGMRAGASHGTAALHFPTPGVGFLAASVLLGEVCSSAWAIGFPLYACRSLLRIGLPQGFGWTKADASGYGVAVGLAVLAAVAAWGLTRLIPPDPARLTGPLEELARSHGWPQVVLLVTGLGIAPFAEEFAFRGAILAAFARRFNTATGVVASTLLFVAMHFADKIHYWPGFIAVGILALAAAWVRVRYRSVRPSMLLHFVYNAMVIGIPAGIHLHGH